MDASPLIDAGVAIIILTILVKLILAPLSKKAVVTQLKVKEIEKDIAEIREKYKDNKQMLGMETMALYKKAGINPFSSIILIIIQLPIMFALYSIFLKSGLPVVDTNLLYSFVKEPLVNMSFLGVFDVAGKSIILALITGVVQFFQIKYSMPPIKKAKENSSFQDDLARSVNMQMRFVFPVIITVIAYTTKSAIAIYLIISALFTIGQELYIRKKLGIDRTKDK
jgi:YidC/Oxa1 family membrane protein insertase